MNDTKENPGGAETTERDSPSVSGDAGSSSDTPGGTEAAAVESPVEPDEETTIAGIRFLEFQDTSESEEFRRMPLPLSYPVRLLMRASLFRQVLEQSLAAAPLDDCSRHRETGGIFAGEVIAETGDDDSVIYRVYVRDYLPVGDGTLVEFTITQQDWAAAGPRLRDLSEKEKRALSYLGVFHSHPGHGVFHSPTDQRALGKEGGLLVDPWQFSLVLDHVSRSPKYPRGNAGIFFDNHKIAEFGLDQPFPHLGPLLDEVPASDPVSEDAASPPSLNGGLSDERPGAMAVVQSPSSGAPAATDQMTEAGPAGPDWERADVDRPGEPSRAPRLLLVTLVLVALVILVAGMLRLFGASNTTPPPPKTAMLTVSSADAGNELRPVIECKLDAAALELLKPHKSRDVSWRISLRKPGERGDGQTFLLEPEASIQDPTHVTLTTLERVPPEPHQFQIMAWAGGQRLLATDWSAAPLDLKLKAGRLQLGAKKFWRKRQDADTNRLHIELSWDQSALPKTQAGKVKLYRQVYPDKKSYERDKEFGAANPAPIPNIDPTQRSGYQDNSITVRRGHRAYVRYWIHGAPGITDQWEHPWEFRDLEPANSPGPAVSGGATNSGSNSGRSRGGSGTKTGGKAGGGKLGHKSGDGKAGGKIGDGKQGGSGSNDGHSSIPDPDKGGFH